MTKKAVQQKDKPAMTSSAKTLEKMQLELRDTLEQMCLSGTQKTVEVVAFGSRNDDLRMLFRVHDEAKWLKVLTQYLLEEEGIGWYSFWGKKYMVKEGRLLYGWNCVIASEDLDDAVQQTRRMLAAADHQVFGATRRTVTEVPMVNGLGVPPGKKDQIKATRPGTRLR